jgi:hypothetical protein
MHHADIQTTMSYYVDLDAAEIADTLWKGFEAEKLTNSNTSGNTGRKIEFEDCPRNDASPCL